MLQAGGLRRPRQAAGLGQLLVGREVLPEERDAVGAVRSGKGAVHAFHVVDVHGDDLGAKLCQLLRPVGVDVARQGAGSEATGRIAGDGTDQSAALGAGGADDGNDLPLGHG